MVEKDPLQPYVVRDTLDIDLVPIEIMTQSLLYNGHYLEDGYVHGIKYVDKNFCGMFGHKYEQGKTYLFDDAERPDARFCVWSGPCGVHGAGLWSMVRPCPDAHAKSHAHSKLNVPILVRYPLNEVMPIGNTLKGRVMEVISTGPPSSWPPMESFPKS